MEGTTKPMDIKAYILKGDGKSEFAEVVKEFRAGGYEEAITLGWELLDGLHGGDILDEPFKNICSYSCGDVQSKCDSAFRLSESDKDILSSVIGFQVIKLLSGINYGILCCKSK